MSIQRPTHLVQRQSVGMAFGEDATLITVLTGVNDFGEPTSTETSAPITCATAPPSTKDDPRVRKLMEGGVAFEALRLFWTVETPRPVADDSAGDIIVFGGERFRVHSVAPWGRGSECVGVRIEGQ